MHHVVPRHAGGTKTIPLCAKCHSKVHGMKLINSYAHRLRWMRDTRDVSETIMGMIRSGHTAKEIGVWGKQNGLVRYETEKWALYQADRLAQIEPQDLLDVFGYRKGVSVWPGWEVLRNQILKGLWK